MDNIYYLFSVKVKYFTDLSYILKNKNIADSFCGLAYAKDPILKANIYRHISYFSDILKIKGEIDFTFLENIEKTYNVNIAEMIHADRHLLRFDREKRLFYAQELLKIFIYEVEKFNINLVIPEAIDDFISFFAAYYCEYHKIKFFYPINIGYAALSCLSSNIYAAPNDFQKKFNEAHQLASLGQLDLSSVKDELVEYVKTKKRPSYFVAGDANYRLFALQDIKIFFQCLYAYFYDKKGMHYDKFPLAIPLYRLLKIYRKLRYRHLIKIKSITIQEAKKTNYFIYPLHFEPEAATLILGRWFNDQRKIIEMISKNMPVNTILLVKEHKPSIGRRPLSFYKEIANHHNVFLIDDNVDTYDLIENSKGVIVISSTMGVEALMLGKPVLSFGERYYNVSKNVYKVDNFKTIKQTLVKMLNHSFEWMDSMAFFHTLLSNTKDLGCLSHLDYAHNDLEILADEIAVLMSFP